MVGVRGPYPYLIGREALSLRLNSAKQSQKGVMEVQKIDNNKNN